MAVSHPTVRTFSHHYRHKFGHGVGKVTLDVGSICPNRALGGCIFCQPASFTPACLDGTDNLLLQLQRGKEHLLKGRFTKYFAYFQQESCTALPTQKLLEILRIPLKDPDCVGLILSTRPDCVEQGLLVSLAGLINHYQKDCLFELGVQSVHNKSLRFLNRNHSYGDFLEAAGRIKSLPCFELGAHLIFGIPKESEEEMLMSLKTVCRSGVDALKLHHLQVISGTPLERLYERGEVSPFSLEGYLQFLTRALPHIPAGITLHRLWATAHPDLLIAPRWNVLASTLSGELRQRMEEAGLWQGKYADNTV